MLWGQKILDSVAGISSLKTLRQWGERKKNLSVWGHGGEREGLALVLAAPSASATFIDPPTQAL